MKMRENDAYFRVFFWPFSHCNIKKQFFNFFYDTICIHIPKKLYWCQFEYNLLFHMNICVSLIVFKILGGGYTLRLIKSKLGMILQDLFFHTKLEWFRQLFDSIYWQYLWQISFLQKKCETRIMKMRLNDTHFRVFFWSFSHSNVKKQSFLFTCDKICIHIPKKHFIDVTVNSIYYFICTFVFRILIS